MTDMHLALCTMTSSNQFNKQLNVCITALSTPALFEEVFIYWPETSQFHHAARKCRLSAVPHVAVRDTVSR